MSRADELRYEFLRKHENASFIVFDTRTQYPIGAVYYSYDWYDTPEMRDKELRSFFSAVIEAEFREPVE